MEEPSRVQFVKPVTSDPITSSPSDVETEEDRQVREIPPRETSYSQSEIVDEEEDEDEDVESDEERLSKFLSATPEVKTQIVKVPSIDMTFVLRSLSSSEYDRIIDMQSGKLLDDTLKQNRQTKKRRKYSQTEIWSETIAMALVSPDFHNPRNAEMLINKFGTPSVADVLLKVLKPVELMALADVVETLSGADELDLVEEAKNS